MKNPIVFLIALSFTLGGCGVSELRSAPTLLLAPDAIPQNSPVIDAENKEVDKTTRDCSTGIQITEIMFNPDATADPLGEFVELYNLSTHEVALDGWTLRNGRREVYVFPPLSRLAAKSVLVLGGSIDPDENGDIPVDLAWTRFSLANRGGLLHLRNPCGDSVDRVRYGIRKPWPTAKAGISIRRIQKISDLEAPKQWRLSRHSLSSGDKGSPGEYPDH